MKILLIEAMKRRSFITRIYPPLGLCYLESYLQKYAGFNLEIRVTSSTDSSMIDRDNPPEIIGISSVTENFTTAIKIGGEIREKLGNKIPVIIGGCHISALPRSLPDVFDIGVIGEGEETFLEIVNLFQQKGKLDTIDVAKISGTAYFDSQDRKEKKTVLTSTPRKSLEDLDIIPCPKRRLAGYGLTHIVTSRGCPYACIYCATYLLWGNVRSHSAEYVAREIEHLYRKENVREIILFDDNFLADKKRIKQISSLLKKNDIAGKIEFTCFGRTRAINQDVVEDLVKMGVKEIYLGADTVFDMKIDGTRDEKAFDRNTRAVDICYEAGMSVNCSFVIGLPRQTMEDLDDIIKFVEVNRYKLKAVQISPVNLFPGTPLWEYAVTKGKIKEEIEDWSILENFTHIDDFSPEKYIYINEMMTPDTFYEYCRRFREIC
ncbi:MAG: B12-binding domain-containing radical SAM protein [Candidatus Eremiobacteraeota bacterium]|nr:B12-binding domain-containing radical SAM protein [Candidatus Eremiobacteraeota bacterium]